MEANIRDVDEPDNENTLDAGETFMFECNFEYYIHISVTHIRQK